MAVEFLSEESCRQYISQLAFKLQPHSYGRDYPKWPGLIGIEVEMLPLDVTDPEHPRTVPLYGGTNALSEILIRLAAVQDGWTCQIVPDSEPAELFRIHLEEGDQLSFEPGGQLEISTIPYPCLSDAAARLINIQKILDLEFEKHQIRLVQTGINPWHQPDEIGLQMHKKRYQAMTDYFEEIGPYGIRMMRQTCTIQVNLDFGADQNAMAQRFAVAQLSAPYATAIFANSPIVDGQLTPYKSFRSKIWQEIDPGRTGFPDLKGAFSQLDAPACITSYIEFALQAPVIFKTQEEYRRPGKGYRFLDWVNESQESKRPTLDDLKVHLSLLFPEVRARGFLELRSMDCQSRRWQLIPSAFYTGLIYDQTALSAALKLLDSDQALLREHWLKSSYGLQDETFRSNAQRLFEIAMEGYMRTPPCFRDLCAEQNVLRFWQSYTSAGRSPADDLIQHYHDKRSKLSWKDLE